MLHCPVPFRAALLLTLTCLAVAGCQQRMLMPTPHLYAYQDDDAFSRVPPALQNSEVDVLYVTDRLPGRETALGPQYGYGRSHSLAFGSGVVAIGDGVTWEQLKQASRSPKRAAALPLKIRQVREEYRFPAVPYPLVEEGPRRVTDPRVLAEVAAAEAALHDRLAARLADSGKQEVYLYVHGFNNTFEDALLTTAEVWHFLGRQGVPVCYTWPAGRGMSGRGYVYDSVSCEFTVFHLKQLLRALGRCPQVERVHILAHSRGTAVTTDALRELHIEHRHAEVPTRTALKLGNVILAAPDLDFDVVQQRIAAERVGDAPEHTTIYVSPADRALAMADVLTLGMTRLGQLQPNELSPQLRELVAGLPVTFVEALVHTGFIGHSYFLDSPAVSSDIIMVLRDNRPAGPEHGRPLKERMKNFYELRGDYLKAP